MAMPSKGRRWRRQIHLARWRAERLAEDKCVAREESGRNMSIPVTWRNDVEALAFQPDGRQGYCMIHRLAFRTLLGFSPTPEDCASFFRDNFDAFQAAANAKIREKNVADGMNFHLTSRDVARRLKLANQSAVG